MTTDKRPEGHSAEGNDGAPTKREAQQPIGPFDGDDTWLSGEDEHEPLREEAAERARRAVEPGRPRE
jgi:hypothetical protein